MAQKAIDDNQGSMWGADTICSVCKQYVCEKMGKHMMKHGDAEFQKYMNEQRAATPQEYRVCPHCSRVFRRTSLPTHVTTMHGESGKANSPGISRPTSGQAEAESSNEIDHPNNGATGGMGPPSSKSRIKRSREVPTAARTSEVSGDNKGYSLGLIQEAVRHMINHRDTATYTRNQVKQACQQQMPGLSEREYDLVTDFTITTAREVAGISQYAAANRNMTATSKYKDS